MTRATTPWAACAAVMLAFVAGLLCACERRRHTQPPASRCEDFQLDVEHMWTRERQVRIGKRLIASTDQKIVEQLVTRTDAILRDWVMLKESACRNTFERGLVPEEVFVKISACMDTTLQRQRTLLLVLEDPARPLAGTQVLALQSEIAQDGADCQYEAVYGAYVPAEATPDPDAARRADLSTARAVVFSRLDQPDAAAAKQDAVAAAQRSGDLLRQYQALMPEYIDAIDASDSRRQVEVAEAQLELAQRIESPSLLGITLLNLARAYQSSGELERGLSHGERALAVLEQAFGPDHIDTGRAYITVAESLAYTGSASEAAALARKGLAVFERRAADDPSLLATVMVSAGGTLLQANDVEGWTTLERAVRLIRERMGTDNILYVTVHETLSSYYARAGDFQRAAATIEIAVEVARRSPAIPPLKLGETLVVAGHMYSAANDHAKAVELLEEGVQILDGSQSPFLEPGRSMLQLARQLRDLE